RVVTSRRRGSSSAEPSATLSGASFPSAPSPSTGARKRFTSLPKRPCDASSKMPGALPAPGSALPATFLPRPIPESAGFQAPVTPLRSPAPPAARPSDPAGGPGEPVQPHAVQQLLRLAGVLLDGRGRGLDAGEPVHPHLGVVHALAEQAGALPGPAAD